MDLKENMISPYLYPGLKLDQLERMSIIYKTQGKITKEYLLEIVAEECGITIDDMVKKGRKREYVDSRHIFCGIARKYLKMTFVTIGDMIGCRDHTTIIYSVKKFRDRYETESVYRQRVDTICKKLGIE